MRDHCYDGSLEYELILVYRMDHKMMMKRRREVEPLNPNTGVTHVKQQLEDKEVPASNINHYHDADCMEASMDEKNKRKNFSLLLSTSKPRSS